MDIEKKVNVLLTDRDMIHQQFFSMLFQSSNDYFLTDTVTSAEETIQFCMENSVDLLLIEACTARGNNTFTTIRQLKREFPGIKVVFLSKFPEYSYLIRAKGAGAEGFWFMNTSGKEFLAILDQVMAGEPAYPENKPIVRIGHALSIDFTAQELRVLKELVTGASDADIAENLFISVNTVKYHVKNLKQKTGLKNRTQLAVEARVSGLVIPDV